MAVKKLKELPDPTLDWYRHQNMNITLVERDSKRKRIQTQNQIEEKPSLLSMSYHEFKFFS